MIGIPLSAARWNQNLIFQLPMTDNHISNKVLLYYKNDLVLLLNAVSVV